MAGLQSGEGRMMIDSVVWEQYINVTGTQPQTTHLRFCVTVRVKADSLVPDVFSVRKVAEFGQSNKNRFSLLRVSTLLFTHL